MRDRRDEQGIHAPADQDPVRETGSLAKVGTHAMRLRARKPTPIRISLRTRNLILVAIVAALLLIVWVVPFVLIISLLGFALALVLSFPVRWFSRFMSRGVAILLSSLIVLAIFVLALLFLVPLIVDQVTALVQNLPALARNLEGYLIAALEPLHERGFLTRTPQEIVSGLGESLRGSLDVITRNTLGGALGFLYGTFNFALPSSAWPLSGSPCSQASAVSRPLTSE